MHSTRLARRIAGISSAGLAPRRSGAGADFV